MSVKDIMEKYARKLESEIESFETGMPSNEAFSREYEIFRNEAMSFKLSSYEAWCHIANRIIPIKPKEEEREKLEEAISIAHLNIMPKMATSFAGLIVVLFIIMGLISGGLMYLLSGEITLATLFAPLVLILIGFAIMKPLSNIPLSIATRWRLKAGDQMMLCILYIVMYMRHTSNMEHAIKFSAQHIGDPLALDLRKVFWDVEVGSYSTIKESLTAYLEKWKRWNLEFVESFNLIESSLFEPDEDKRVERLEKALEVILEGTYNRMLHFAHDLKTPITILHMMGIILPILGLIILPLVGTFLGVKWWHLAILYNLALPFAVYFMGQNILSKRPTGYGGRDILKENPEYERLGKIKFLGIYASPAVPAFFIMFLFCSIGLLPLIVHGVEPSFDVTFLNERLGKFLDYRNMEGMTCGVGEECVGPFGIGAAIVGLLVPLGIALGLGTYYRIKTRKLIKIREETKRLETEFTGSLFQLGSRIGDGIPSELAFGRVAENMRGTPTGEFLEIADANMRQRGMSLEDAIFNRKIGAILYFPSRLVESSMEVLIESARKGPQIVAKCLISISQYIQRINQISERLKDLLADVTSEMRGQIIFLTPMIAGIVVGIGSMLTTIIGKLSFKLGQFQMGQAETTEIPINVQQLIGIFPTSSLMPPYYFQLVVGIYVIEIIFILTMLSNAIENGMDKLTQEHRLGKYLYSSMFFYTIVALIVTILFTFMAGVVAVLGGAGT